MGFTASGGLGAGATGYAHCGSACAGAGACACAGTTGSASRPSAAIETKALIVYPLLMRLLIELRPFRAAMRPGTNGKAAILEHDPEKVQIFSNKMMLKW